MRALKFQSLFLTLLSIAILSNSSSAGEQQQQQQPVVDIPTLGRLVGSQLSSASGRKFHAFRAIPYALPPVGDHRFKVSIFINSFHCKNMSSKLHSLPKRILFQPSLGMKCWTPVAKGPFVRNSIPSWQMVLSTDRKIVST